MTVSRRNTALGVMSVMSVISGLALSSAAFAGDNTGSSSEGGCCHGSGGHIINVPGVHVGGPHISVSHGHIISKSYLNVNVVRGHGQTIISGGGGGFHAPQGMRPTTIEKLNVEGNVETYTETVTEQVPTLEKYCREEITYQMTWRPVQAVCLDDKGTPHPASRVDATTQVAPDHKGELFRCMAGTHMMITLGHLDQGKSSFAQGQSFACQKGEALVHKGNGQLSCAPQKPQRSCNERSLLRRHGPGLKLVQARLKNKSCVPAERTVMKTVSHQVERTRQGEAEAIILDGGVGQGVY